VRLFIQYYNGKYEFLVSMGNSQSFFSYLLKGGSFRYSQAINTHLLLVTFSLKPANDR